MKPALRGRRDFPKVNGIPSILLEIADRAFMDGLRSRCASWPIVASGGAGGNGCASVDAGASGGLSWGLPCDGCALMGWRGTRLEMADTVGEPIWGPRQALESPWGAWSSPSSPGARL